MRNLNFEVFREKAENPTFDHFQGTIKPFLNKKYIGEVNTALDIGGACGELLHLINRDLPNIKGTVLEIDKDCISWGKKAFSELSFLYGKFPDKKSKKKYDLVLMQALFPHMVDWKGTILEMARLSNRFFTFQPIICEHGQTVADDTTSFFYYMNTGKRCAQVINNIWELLSFLCLEEIGAKRIYVIMHTGDLQKDRSALLEAIRREKRQNKSMRDIVIQSGDGAHVFRSKFYMDTFFSSVFVEMFLKNERPKRMGGMGKVNRDKYPEYKFTSPIIDVYLNNKLFFAKKEDKIYYTAHTAIKSSRYSGEFI